jgi:hypothetical protein
MCATSVCKLRRPSTSSKWCKFTVQSGTSTGRKSLVVVARMVHRESCTGAKSSDTNPERSVEYCRESYKLYQNHKFFILNKGILEVRRKNLELFNEPWTDISLPLRKE